MEELEVPSVISSCIDLSAVTALQESMEELEVPSVISSCIFIETSSDFVIIIV